MPGPDPHGIDLEEYGDRFTLRAEVWPNGNRRARIARLKAIRRNLSCGGWLCIACREPVPIYKRADAVFCGDGCRKRSARRRRWARSLVKQQGNKPPMPFGKKEHFTITTDFPALG